jgi:hypothetical protein
MSKYDDLGRLFAFYESAAELVRLQIRAGATIRAASAQYVRARAADRRQAQQARGTSRAVIDRRMRTANELAQFDPQEPKRPEDLAVPVTGLGALVRRGYLRRQGGGFIRTAKPFHVDPSARRPAHKEAP